MSNLCPIKNFVRPDKPHGCTYEHSLKDPSIKSPHTSLESKPRNSNNVCGNILDMIGNTPLVHLKNISQDYGIKCNLYAKCEFMNAGGSVKDRIGLRMIEEAEKSGTIKPGDYIIEPTSGNTGIGLALACAVKGYKCIIVMPEKMSKEKNDIMKGLGATIIRTPTSAAFDAPDSNISEAQRIKERLNAENPGCAHILDQYTNPYNPIAHYDSTGQEIVDQLNGKVDYMIATAGTGGTICGLARKLKEKCPDCKVIGVDPMGSILAQPNELNGAGGFYEVEGIGYDFIPTVLDRTRVDAWFKSVDKPSFQMSRQLLKREGLMCGGSCGSAVYCAIEAIKKYNIGENQNVVVLLADSVRNYMTKFLSDEWMITRGFIDLKPTEYDSWWVNNQIGDLKSFMPSLTHNLIDENVSCASSIELMKERSVDCLLTTKDGMLSNVITKKNLMAKLVSGSINPSDPISKAKLDRYVAISVNDKIKRLQCSLDSEGYAIVVKGDETTMNKIKESDLEGVADTNTFLRYIASNNNDTAKEEKLSDKLKEIKV